MHKPSAVIFNRCDLINASSEKPANDITFEDIGYSLKHIEEHVLVLFIDDDLHTYVLKNGLGAIGEVVGSVAPEETDDDESDDMEDDDELFDEDDTEDTLHEISQLLDTVNALMRYASEDDDYMIVADTYVDDNAEQYFMTAFQRVAGL
jgi:hypothetical protein